MEEEWKMIPCSDEFYQVSSLGEVRRKNSVSRYSKRQPGFHKIKPVITQRGYELVILSIHAKRIGKLVHRLVMEAFVGSCPAGSCVHHIDHNKLNNKLENLCYTSCSENQMFAIEAGRVHPKRGQDTYNARLSEEDITEIRNHATKNGRGSGVYLSKKYGVSTGHISAIINNKARIAR